MTNAKGPQAPVPPCGCGDDPIEGLKRLFVDYYQGVGLAAGRDPATRPVFLRLHGVAHGTFEIRGDLPAALRVGLFAQAACHPVWVRFSSDVQPGAPDAKGTCGVALKLFDVPGEKLLAPDEHATTHDFLLQNHDVFFVDTARDMCEFTCAALTGGYDAYLAAHPETRAILDAMAKDVASVLATPYWSGLPSRLGPAHYVKYKLEPESAATGAADTTDPEYLRADLHARLLAGEARFRFLVQLQTTDAEMPTNRATVRWSEQASAPVHVATLILPQQDVAARGQSAYGENLSFNPWRALAAHEPAGSIMAARRVVYAASAANRRNTNGVPLGEPTAPRPATLDGGDYPAARDTRIVRAAIHPAIGIARLGPSDDCYVGPEVPDPPPAAPGSLRDAHGALKRQAARFRLYGYNCAGEIVRELTADWADIRWRVRVANKKASWYQWQQALDVPEASALAPPRRNATISDRASLEIDSGEQTITGKGTTGPTLAGAYAGVPVALGDLRTDDAGRLLVLAGRGVSASPTNTKIYDPADADSFINADGWYDDICDGPVSADVHIAGTAIPVEGAWVTSAPPNYGQNIKTVRTMYDLLVDLYVTAGWLVPPAPVSFRRDVAPILRRLADLQWVNQGFAAQFGHGAPHDFTDDAYLARLGALPAAGEYDLNAELRRQILLAFRPPVPPDGNQLPWPWFYGDSMDVPAAATPRQNSSVSATQYRVLQAWADGAFVADWRTAPAPPSDLAGYDLAAQPAALDRAALDFCLADAFHPGCELTWPMRHLTLYAAPFRVRRRPDGVPAPDYGAKLTPAVALGFGGPLYAQGPGELSRWMGLPWQADTAYCRSGYDPKYDPLVPTFWPARVPNQVLAAADYAIVVDEHAPIERRREAFGNRTSWVKPLHGSVAEQMVQMVRIFASMGVLEQRPGPGGEFPSVMHVAAYGPDVPAPDAAETAAAPPVLRGREEAPPHRAHRPAGANFRSDAEASESPRPVRRRPR